MAIYNIQPSISVNVGANGETAAGNMTNMGLYMGLFGLDLYMKSNEKDSVGSILCGAGSITTYSTNSRTVLYNQMMLNNLYVYFYNSTNSAMDSDGILPSFMDSDLTVDTTKIIATGNHTTNISDVSSLKEGIVVARDSEFNLLSPLSGLTYNWPIGQGTGQFNSFCISLCDLEKLKTNDVISNVSLSAEQYPVTPFYLGKCFGVNKNVTGLNNSYTGTHNVLCYIRNNVTGITGANEMLLKFKDRVGVWVLNLLTGSLTTYTGSYDGYMSLWGSNMIEISGKYYGLTNKTTIGTDSIESYTYVFCWDPTNTTYTVGSSAVSSLYFVSNLLYDGTTLMARYNPLYFNFSTNSSNKPQFYPIDLTTLNRTGNPEYYTVPSYMGNAFTICNMDESNTYMLHNYFNGVSYIFTDLTDIENSITGVRFVSCSQPLTFNTNMHIYVGFCFQGLEGGYQLQSYTDSGSSSQNYPSTYLNYNQSYSGVKYGIFNDSASPILTYCKFSQTYDKTSSIDFTSSYYIQASSSTNSNS